MVFRSYALMVHHWENGIKQAIARKCRDSRRDFANDDDDDDEDNECEAIPDEQGDRRRLVQARAREFLDVEAIEARDDDDEGLPDLNTPPAALSPTPTQTQDEPYFRR